VCDDLGDVGDIPSGPCHDGVADEEDTPEAHEGIGRAGDVVWFKSFFRDSRPSCFLFPRTEELERSAIEEMEVDRGVATSRKDERVEVGTAGAGSETGVGATGSGVEAEALDAGGAAVCVTHLSAGGWTL
jgi:hypothetical protein